MPPISQDSFHSEIPAAAKRLRGPALFVAALGAFAAMASPSFAAGECVNGYRTLGNQVIVLCDDASGVGPAHSQAFFNQPTPAVAPPAATGTAVQRHGSVMVDGAHNCQPGMYYRFELAESGDVILAC